MATDLASAPSDALGEINKYNFVTQTHGIFKAGVIVEDFDRMLAALKARQLEIAYGPYPARANQRANVIVRDNAGNLLQFFGKSAAPGN